MRSINCSFFTLFLVWETIEEMKEVRRGSIENQFAYQIPEFWKFWINRDLYAKYVDDFCTGFFKDINVATQNDFVVIIVASVITAAFHFIYLVVLFIPSTCILLRRKNKILELISTIPVEHVYSIADSLDKKVKKHSPKEISIVSSTVVLILMYVT